ncbi:hypothetical protein GCM10022245_19320 [Streptomyces mayteni]
MPALLSELRHKGQRLDPSAVSMSRDLRSLGTWHSEESDRVGYRDPDLVELADQRGMRIEFGLPQGILALAFQLHPHPLDGGASLGRPARNPRTPPTTAPAVPMPAPISAATSGVMPRSWQRAPGRADLLIQSKPRAAGAISTESGVAVYPARYTPTDGIHGNPWAYPPRTYSASDGADDSGSSSALITSCGDVASFG